VTVIVLVPFNVESQKFGIVMGLWKIYGRLIFFWNAQTWHPNEL